MTKTLSDEFSSKLDATGSFPRHRYVRTSQLNSMSDSIVLILTLKFLGCFLNSELNPIFAAKALAMSTGGGYTN